jgi:predicted Zn-dependent peptidase
LRRELEGLARQVSTEEVERAKAACKCSVFAALESPSIVAEDIARQISSYGRRLSLDDFKSAVDVRPRATICHCSAAFYGVEFRTSALLLGS